MCNKILAVRLSCGQHTLCCQDASRETHIRNLFLEISHHLFLFKDMVLYMKLGHKQERPPPSSCYWYMQ